MIEMENINYNLIISGPDFKSVKYLSRFVYFSLKNENYETSILLTPSSNISNYSLSYSAIKVGKSESLSCLGNINAILSLDYQSILNFLPFIDADTLIISDYSVFNACEYYLSDNETVTERLSEKTKNVFKIPINSLIDLESMGKNKVSPYIALVGAFVAKSGLMDIDSVCGETSAFSRNDSEKKNSIYAILKGYDFVSE